MAETFDFIVVGGGSAGAVIAARLSEDPACRVALLEAGGLPPERELMPAACASLQGDPETDWMGEADPGRAGLGLRGRRMLLARGRMLGGGSGINYMVYVRGHPGDYDAWSAAGAAGWAHADVLPYFRKIEDFAPGPEPVFDAEAHGVGGPMGVSIRRPLPATPGFMAAARRTGACPGDYNGADRGGPDGVVGPAQTSTRGGRRSSAYRAYLRGEAEARPNLAILTGAWVTRLILDGEGDTLAARGVAYRTADGADQVIAARVEVIVCAGAIGSPHLLMLSGIGPRDDLAAVGIACRRDLPAVGRGLKDHLQCLMRFPAPGLGVAVDEIRLSMGPDALGDGREDRVAEARRRRDHWELTGEGLAASSMVEALAFFSSGLGDPHSHDIQIGFTACGFDRDQFEHGLNIDTAAYFADPGDLDTAREAILIAANPVLPRSEGKVTLASADPASPPRVDLNCYDDPHDLKVMVAAMRRVLAIAEAWPGPTRPGPLAIPHTLAARHGHVGDATPSDALLADMALHVSTSMYHHARTCRIGAVVDADLKVKGVGRLRVADASVMPDLVSGNINAACLMIGEKAAEMIAAEHGVRLRAFVGRF